MGEDYYSHAVRTCRWQSTRTPKQPQHRFDATRRRGAYPEAADLRVDARSDPYKLASATVRIVSRRRPAGVRFESWNDRQIRQATERGEFSDLSGAGAPLADLNEPYDKLWWVKRKLRSENLSYLPPSLALRMEAHDALEGAGRAITEAEARELIDAINEKIRDSIRMGSAARMSTSSHSTSSG